MVYLDDPRRPPACLSAACCDASLDVGEALAERADVLRARAAKREAAGKPLASIAEVDGWLR